MSEQVQHTAFEDWQSNGLGSELESFPVQVAEFDDRKVSYRRSKTSSNASPTLVFLHGIGSSSSSWVKQFQTLGSVYDMIAWDMPGYMLSTPIGLPRPRSVDYANVLRGFLTHLDVHKPILIGHSLGALQALAYPVNSTNDISGLVLANPALGYDHLPCSEKQKIAEKRIGMFRDLGPSDLGIKRSPRLLSDEASEEDINLVRHNMSLLNEVGYSGACQMLVSGNAMSDAIKYLNNVCVITGDKDNITPAGGAAKLSKKFINSTFVELKGAGHASYIEKPTEFNTAVSAYINTLQSKREL